MRIALAERLRLPALSFKRSRLTIDQREKSARAMARAPCLHTLAPACKGVTGLEWLPGALTVLCKNHVYT